MSRANLLPDFCSTRQASTRKTWWLRKMLGCLLLMLVCGVPCGPAFATSTIQSGCINNLRMIRGAVEQWALQRNIAQTNSYSLSNSNILSYLKNGTLPQCGEGGYYLAGNTVAD